MKLQVVRTQFGKDATNGLLFIDGVFECYTLEDQYQAVKVMHETCIPEGTYDISLERQVDSTLSIQLDIRMHIMVCYIYKMYQDLHIS